MRSSTLLRIVTGLAALQYAAHASLFLRAARSADHQALTSIPANRLHSYWDLYFGYGLVAILFGVVEIGFLCLLVSATKVSRGIVRPGVTLLLVANLLHALIVWKYFSLPAPVIFDLVIAAILGCVAWVESQTHARQTAGSQDD